MPAPAIMEGGGETRGKQPPPPSPENVGSVAPKPATTTISSGSAGFSCSGELARIANYAASVAQGVATSPYVDLKLFDAAGRPTENLAKVMANMSAVEIGPDRPRDYLIVAAVAQLRRMLEDPAAAALAATPAPEEETPAAAQ